MFRPALPTARLTQAFTPAGKNTILIDFPIIGMDAPAEGTLSLASTLVYAGKL